MSNMNETLAQQQHDARGGWVSDPARLEVTRLMPSIRSGILFLNTCLSPGMLVVYLLTAIVAVIM